MLAFFDIGKIVDDKVAEIASKVGDKWTDLWSPIWDGWPLWWSYGVFGLILLGAIGIGIVIRLFLPGDWAKLPLLSMFVGILAAIGWLFGRVTMYNEMKTKLDAERAKRKR